MPDQHAKLSPSAAHRWLRCPGSVEWESLIADPGSEAADEGTAAHALAEARLKGDFNAIQKAMRSPWYSTAMDSYIDRYVDYVHDLMPEGDYSMHVEHRVEILPDCWGTSDCIISSDQALHVVDLKYGKGVKVEAPDNPQGLLYAYGALNEMGYLWSFPKVCFHIVQPRLDHISTWEMKVEDVVKKVEDPEFLHMVEAARDGVPEYHGGTHCKFCKAAPICRELARWRAATLLDAIEAGVTREIDSVTLGGLLKLLPEFESWLKKLKDQAQTDALRGAKIPGYKLVSGRGVRKITDTNAALDRLHGAGFDPMQYMELRGLTDLEKAVGRKELAQVLGDLIVKSDGKPTLVADSDPRPAYSSAAEDFKDDFKEDM